MTKTFEKALLGIIFVALLGVNSFFIFGAQDTEVPNEIVKEETKEITENEARSIALKTAEGVIKEFKEKTANGVTFYEVEMEDEFMETEFKIDKKDGKILNIKQEEKDNEVDEKVSKEELEKITDKISEKRAIEIAKGVVNGRVIFVEVERENGKLIYEIEMEYQGDTVEVEVDGITGKILETEWGDD